MFAIEIAFFTSFKPIICIGRALVEASLLPTVWINLLSDVMHVPDQTPLGEGKVRGQEADKVPITPVPLFSLSSLCPKWGGSLTAK